jgi:hypothetical protein
MRSSGGYLGGSGNRAVAWGGGSGSRTGGTGWAGSGN